MANKSNKPFLPTLNGIRSATEGKVRGQDVAEAFDALNNTIGDLQAEVAGVKSTTTTIVQKQAAGVIAAGSTPQSTPNPNSFDTITTGTNIQADMVVSSGASLEYDPTPGATGVVDANEIGTINVAGNVPAHPGQLLISQPGNTSAIWADPQVQGLYAEGDSIISPPAYIAPTTIQPVYTGVRAGDALQGLRTCDTFKTFQGQGGTPSSDPIWSPASNKKFRLMKIYVAVSGNATVANAGLLTVHFTDGPAGPTVGPSFDIYIPPLMPTLGAGVFAGTIFDTGVIDMDNGYLSATANNTLYMHASLQLATGFIRINTFGTEE